MARAGVKKAAANSAKADVAAVLAEIKRSGSPAYKANMAARFGIVTKAPVYGLDVGTLRAMAKRLGPDHALAEALWKSGVHDARMLAAMVDNAAEVTPAQMDRWVKDCDNWALVDTACFHYWDRTPYAAKQIEKWASAKGEFVKRAAFALMASCALHKHSTEGDQLKGLKLIEREAHDARNFVKKAVSWALRSIGGRGSAKVRAAAREVAKRLAQSEDAAERWVGKDALREFNKKGGSAG
jgi:3-methyladenine DNA glycosylase AlkD